MSGNDTAALVVALSAQLTKFEQDMDNAAGIADKGVRKIEDRFKKVNPQANLEGFIGDLQKLAAVGGISEIARAITDLNEKVAKIGESAETVGLTTDQFQKFRFAVVSTGGSIDSADAFLIKFSNNIALAAKGQGDLYNFLRANNVAIRDNSGQLLPNNTLLAKYADLVKNTKSPQDQLNEAIMVGGRQAGPELVSALRNGADGLRAFGIEAENAGVIIDGSLIERAKKANEQFQVLKLRATTVFEEAAVAVVEEFQKKNAEMDKIGQGWADSLKNAWKSAVDYINENSPDGKRIIGNIQDLINNTPVSGPRLNRIGADILSPLGGSSPDSRLLPPPAPPAGDGTTKQFNAQADAINKLIKAQQDRVNLLNAENQSVGKSIYDSTYLTEKIKLEAEARKLNNDQKLAPAQLAQIDAKAQKIAAATAALDAHKRAWAGVNSAIQFAGDQAIDVLDGLRQGTLSAADGVKQLGNAFIHAAEQALLLGSGPLASVFGTQSAISGGTGGLFGAVASIFTGGSGGIFGFSDGGEVKGFDSGGYTGSGGKYVPAGVVHRGEYVFDADATSRIGVANLEQLRRGFADGGYVGNSIVPNTPVSSSGGASRDLGITVMVDVTGANGDEAIKQIAAQATAQGVQMGLSQYDKSLPGRLKEIRTRGL